MRRVSQGGPGLGGRAHPRLPGTFLGSARKSPQGLAALGVTVTP